MWRPNPCSFPLTFLLHHFTYAVTISRQFPYPPPLNEDTLYARKLRGLDSRQVFYQDHVSLYSLNDERTLGLLTSLVDKMIYTDRPVRAAEILDALRVPLPEGLERRRMEARCRQHRPRSPPPSSHSLPYLISDAGRRPDDFVPPPAPTSLDELARAPLDATSTAQLLRATADLQAYLDSVEGAHPLRLGILRVLGDAQAAAGKLEEAEATLRQALVLARKLYPEINKMVFFIEENLGKVLVDRAYTEGAAGKYDEAVRLLRPSVEFLWKDFSGGRFCDYVYRSVRSYGYALLGAEHAAAAVAEEQKRTAAASTPDSAAAVAHAEATTAASAIEMDGKIWLARAQEMRLSFLKTSEERKENRERLLRRSAEARRWPNWKNHSAITPGYDVTQITGEGATTSWRTSSGGGGTAASTSFTPFGISGGGGSGFGRSAAPTFSTLFGARGSGGGSSLGRSAGAVAAVAGSSGGGGSAPAASAMVASWRTTSGGGSTAAPTSATNIGGLGTGSSGGGSTSAGVSASVGGSSGGSGAIPAATATLRLPARVFAGAGPGSGAGTLPTPPLLVRAPPTTTAMTPLAPLPACVYFSCLALDAPLTAFPSASAIHLSWRRTATPAGGEWVNYIAFSEDQQQPPAEVLTPVSAVRLPYVQILETIFQRGQ